MNWSGGKDSALCLHYIWQDATHSVDCLLTSVNAAHNRISMHGVRRELLEQQAEAIGLPLQTIELPEQPGMQEYEQAMLEKVCRFRENGYTHAVFGDIFLEDLKRYREEKLQTVDMQAVFPLWKIDTKQLMDDFLRSGFKAIIVCVNEKFLDKSFCGRLIDESFVRDLPPGVDVCGENGEYFAALFYNLDRFIHAGTQVFMVLFDSCDISMITSLAAQNNMHLHCVHTRTNLLEKNYIYKIEMYD